MRIKLLIFLLVLPTVAVSTQRHVVASGGVSSGSALSEGTGWTLDWAISSSNTTLQAGDTVWLHGGNYSKDGEWNVTKDASAGSPILYRNHNNERATIINTICTSGGSRSDVLNLDGGGEYTWWWGIEIKCTAPDYPSGWGTDHSITGMGIQINEPGVKIINCVVHDAVSNGITTWVQHSGTSGAEIYGCLLYYNGRTGGSYQIYGQNQNGYKDIVDNVALNVFAGYSYHIYTESSYLDSFRIAGNILSATGTKTAWGHYFGGAHIYIGATNQVSRYPKIDSNCVYGERDSSVVWTMSNLLELGGNKGCEGTLLRGNYFMRGRSANSDCTLSITHSGNTFYGDDAYWDFSKTGDTWIVPPGSHPDGTTRIVRPNKYETKRANIAIYNWDTLDAVKVDLSSFLSVNDSYYVYDAYNFYGGAVTSGKYSGDSVSFDMTLTTVATPVSVPTESGFEAEYPEHNDGRFGVFIVTGSANPQDPAPAPRKRHLPKGKRH